ncbi:uracil-DNA glycosylase [soil metagenome]
MPSITQEWKGGGPAPGWRAALREEFGKEYMHNLIAFLDEERTQHTIFPEPKNIFRAFSLTDYDDVNVVILGQDPYHGPNQAHGLSFSVVEGIETPPSLQNIFKEIASDIGCPPPRHGNLERWAKQGVFLLNTVMTVRRGQSNSHQKKGWENFTGAVIDKLSAREKPIVFMLWGRNALAHKVRIDTTRHLILSAPHPSPLSAHTGFFGCRHFSQANQFLKEKGEKEIVW